MLTNLEQREREIYKAFLKKQGVISMPDGIFEFIMFRIAAIKSEITKAFGGCTDCYGKGYATTRETISGGHGRSAIHFVVEPMRFCKCDRGTQLKAHTERREAELREDVRREAIQEMYDELVIHTPIKIQETNGTKFDEGYIFYQDMVLDNLRKLKASAAREIRNTRDAV